MRRIARNQNSVAILCGRRKQLPRSRKEKEKKDKHSDCIIEVLAVFELTSTAGMIDLQEGARVVKLIIALGLDLVGCAIGTAPLAPLEPKKKKTGKESSGEKDSKQALWRPIHVLSSLQLKSLLPAASNESLAIISVALNGSDISLEAYQLSDQAIELHEKKILPEISLNVKTTAADEDKVFLNSEVLVQNDEVTSVDCALFSVPLAIVSVDKSSPSGIKKIITPNRRGKVSTLASTSNPDSIKVEALTDGDTHFYSDMTCPCFNMIHIFPVFEHVFLTSKEIQESERNQLIIQKHVVKTLKISDSNELRKRLSDPHLLQYLSAFLDDDCGHLLCSFVGGLGGNTRIPSKLSMALDMLKISFNDAQSCDED
jgi:hypothetical protein